jgi:hypothetical protein
MTASSTGTHCEAFAKILSLAMFEQQKVRAANDQVAKCGLCSS